MKHLFIESSRHLTHLSHTLGSSYTPNSKSDLKSVLPGEVQMKGLIKALGATGVLFSVTRPC